MYQEISNKENVEYIAVLWGYACMEISIAICENINTLLKGFKSCKSEWIKVLSNMKHMDLLDYLWWAYPSIVG